MDLRRVHKIIGLVLLLPFLGWIVTALIFYVKPGYAEAYASLQCKTYPLDGNISVAAESAWREFRCVKTILGNHLLVRTSEGWKQLDPATLRPRPSPAQDEIRMLLTDAFSANPQRYGNVTTIQNDSIQTSTGILILFDWNDLSLYQRGPDTDRIDLLYRIHYLQWTGVSAIDKILGPLGLVLVLMLSMFGLRLAFGSRRKAA